MHLLFFLCFLFFHGLLFFRRASAGQINPATLAALPKESSSAQSCFLAFNDLCNSTLLKVLVEVQRLNQSKDIEVSGIDFANPSKSSMSLHMMLERIERSKEYTSGELNSEYETLETLLNEFYDVAGRSEVHIIFGAYRSKFAQGFLVNPCSFVGVGVEEPVEEFFELVDVSCYIGSVLKSFYLTNVLGISFMSSNDLYLAVVNNEKYPQLGWFTDFGRRFHVDPV